MLDMLITRGIKDVDEEPMITGFYDLKNNLKKLNIFKELIMNLIFIIE